MIPISLNSVRYAVIIHSWHELKKSSSTASSFAVIPIQNGSMIGTISSRAETIASAASAVSIEKFTRHITAKFHPAITFIMPMVILSTMIPITSFVFQELHTSLGMRRTARRFHSSKSHGCDPSARKRRNGINRKRAELGIVSMGNACGKSGSQLSEHATTVERCSQALLDAITIDSARIPVSPRGDGQMALTMKNASAPPVEHRSPSTNTRQLRPARASVGAGRVKRQLSSARVRFADATMKEPRSELARDFAPKNVPGRIGAHRVWITKSVRARSAEVHSWSVSLRNRAPAHRDAIDSLDSRRFEVESTRPRRQVKFI